ncbi:sugar ABC transporter permease [Salinifilum aidingensis]
MTTARTPTSPQPPTSSQRAASEQASRRGVRHRSRERRLARLGWLYTSPALAVVAAVTLFPVAFSVVLSFTEVQMTYEGFRLEGFTWDNYATLLRSGEWYYSVAFTVGYTVVTVLAELVLGVLAALVLERLGAARGWFIAFLLIPWSMITVISAELWGYIYDATYGAATWTWQALTGTTPLILGEPAPAIAGMMVADIWKTTPFVAVIALAGLMMLPRELYESAEVDGAGAWTTFWRVTLPQLRSTLAVAVLFRTLQAFGVFDLPFVLTEGGPGTATQSLAILTYQTLFRNLQIGTGAAIATTTALLVVGACLLFLRAFRAQVGKEDTA